MKKTKRTHKQKKSHPVSSVSPRAIAIKTPSFTATTTTAAMKGLQRHKSRLRKKEYCTPDVASEGVDATFISMRKVCGDNAVATGMKSEMSSFKVLIERRRFSVYCVREGFTAQRLLRIICASTAVNGGLVQSGAKGGATCVEE